MVSASSVSILQYRTSVKLRQIPRTPEGSARTKEKNIQRAQEKREENKRFLSEETFTLKSKPNFIQKRGISTNFVRTS